MKPKILLTRLIPDSALRALQEECEVIVWNHEEKPVSKDFLEENIKDVDGLYCLLTDQIDKNLLSKAAKLKIISTMAVGYNHIDVEEATARGIWVTNTPEVLTETTADLTFALLLATARRLVEGSTYLREGKWDTWSPMLLAGRDVFGSTLGVIGMGRIGESVVRRAKGFEMNILYHNRSRKHEIEEKYNVEYTSLNELLKRSDFIVIMTPYTNETANLISMEQLKRMKKTSILINTARGGIVNEHDLYEALKQEIIWAAGLDTFEQEPMPTDHPLLTLPNVVTLPHIGSATIETRTKMAHLAADNLLHGLQGRKPPCLINPEALIKN
ncbi:2-hydroxyacid dehydrogenase [Alkalihalobacillus sp. 1P02AB]|uniref:2-hydroxyacid dehydrogenase n=1 Tax=Alkalihalobacillus sp. 1P02AB TaxID=3132260 RepID=UPI0039A63973